MLVKLDVPQEFFFDYVPAERINLNLSQSGYYFANQLIATFGLIRIGVGTTNEL